MEQSWLWHPMVALATAGLVGLVVLLHYEGLAWLSRQFPASRGPGHRAWVLYAVFGVLALHALAISLFGLGFWLLVEWPGAGSLSGLPGHHFLEYVYFSATTYTSLGYGDIIPHGPLRLLAGMEALAGLVLIGWSASFIFIEMDRLWRT